MRKFPNVDYSGVQDYAMDNGWSVRALPTSPGLIFAGSAISSNIVSPAQSRLKLTLMIGRFIGFGFEEA